MMLSSHAMAVHEDGNRGAALVDRVLAATVSDGKIAGIVATAATDAGVIYEGAFGRKDISRSQPMSTDSIFRIASMTKAITSVAAMQLVEQGELSLDRPAEKVLPFLADTKVLQGFDVEGKAILRERRGEITLRKLLTHTAGFVYRMWNEDMARYAKATGLPVPGSGSLQALEAPLGFDPGERWEYGINTDVVGRMVEVASGLDLEAYLRRHILEPLQMKDTSFFERPDWQDRLTTNHARRPDGSLEPIVQPSVRIAKPEFIAGGGGLLSTASDYLRFLRALLRGGELDGQPHP